MQPLEDRALLSAAPTISAEQAVEIALDGFTATPRPEQFRVSETVAPLDDRFDAFTPSVAYDPSLNVYLVVWRRSDPGGGGVVFGQFVDARTGTSPDKGLPIGDITINDATNRTRTPDVAFNPQRREYLVVWSGEDDGLEREIYGARVHATGSTIDSEFRVSQMGPDDETEFEAFHPAVTYNSVDDDYLVVWAGDDATDGDQEIHGQRLQGEDASPIGDNFQISSMADEGDPNFDPQTPDVAYDPANNLYQIVWASDDNEDASVEIHGSAHRGDTGEVVSGNVQISETEFGAFSPAIAYNSRDDEFLVVWSADGETRIAGGPPPAGDLAAGGRRERLPHQRHGPRRVRRIRRLPVGGSLQRQRQRVPRGLARRRRHLATGGWGVRDLRPTY